ncbi:MAG: four helix bundle protein [Bacteroidetes bacterium]|nr:four helix bundle protein [Bacteroidota bacterium]
MKKEENIIVDKSYKFSLRIIKLFRFVNKNKNEYVLSKQVLRSGTSVGALIQEAMHAESNADFIHKLSISLKEAYETQYWLRLLHDSDIINEKSSNSILKDCTEIIKILTSIINTSKSKIK